MTREIWENWQQLQTVDALCVDVETLASSKQQWIFEVIKNNSWAIHYWVHVWTFDLFLLGFFLLGGGLLFSFGGLVLNFYPVVSDSHSHFFLLHIEAPLGIFLNSNPPKCDFWTFLKWPQTLLGWKWANIFVSLANGNIAWRKKKVFFNFLSLKNLIHSRLKTQSYWT